MTDHDRPSPRTAALLGLVAAMAVAVIVLAAAAFSRPPIILCAECEDPYRPQNTQCDADMEDLNPITVPGGLGYERLTCEI